MIVLVSSKLGKTGEKKERARRFCLRELGFFIGYVPSFLAYWRAERLVDLSLSSMQD